MLADLVVAMAAQFTWYMLQFSTCFPDVLAATLHPSADVGQAVVDQARRTWQNACKLSTGLAPELLNDLHWAHTYPIVHELVHVFDAHNWQVAASAVRSAAYETFAGVPDTKRVLEDVFADLKNVSQRCKNKHMSRYHGFFEAAFAKILHPSAKQAASPSLVPPASDWDAPPCCPAQSDGRRHVQNKPVALCARDRRQ